MKFLHALFSTPSIILEEFIKFFKSVYIDEKEAFRPDAEQDEE